MEKGPHKGRKVVEGVQPSGELSLRSFAMLESSPVSLGKHPPIDLSRPPTWNPRRRTDWLAPATVASLAKGIPMGLIVPVSADSDLPPDFDADSEQAPWRRMTVREAAKLQDVPSWYEFGGSVTSQYRQVGNGVPVNLARAVARHILRAFGRKPDPWDGLGLWAVWPGEDGCSSYVSADRLRRRRP